MLAATFRIWFIAAAIWLPVTGQHVGSHKRMLRVSAIALGMAMTLGTGIDAAYAHAARAPSPTRPTPPTNAQIEAFQLKSS